MKGLEEGHGLDQGDIDVLQNFVDRAEVKDRKIKKILKFIIKSNILQDKTKDLSIKEDKFSNAAMNDVMQSIRNLAHTTGMDELEAAEIAINEIKIEFGVDAFHESVNEAEGSTINLSQSDMDKLHSNGKLDLDGHKLVYKTNEVKEDLDIGHQDDEPGMLKAELARAGQMIQMLYRSIDKYDGQGEVDFPQWWQAKIIKANAMLDSAFDYLDGKEMVAKIDAMIDRADEIEVDIDVVNEVKVGDILTKDGKKGKVVKVMDDMANVDFGNGDVYGITFGRIKGKEIVNEDEVQKRLDAEKAIKSTLKDEGGAAGIKPLAKAVKKLGINKDELLKMIKKVVGVAKHKHGDYISTPINEIDYDEALTLRGMKAELKDQIAQLFRDMEQEAEPEGGPIADRYGDELNKLEDRLEKINKQLRDYDMNEATRQDLGMVSSVSKRRAKAELKKPGNDGSKVYGLDKDGKRVHIKSINDVDKFKKFELDADLNEGTDNEKELKGQEMVDYIMKNWDWSEEKTLKFLADKFGNKKSVSEFDDKSMKDYGDAIKTAYGGMDGGQLFDYFNQKICSR